VTELYAAINYQQIPAADEQFFPNRENFLELWKQDTHFYNAVQWSKIPAVKNPAECSDVLLAESEVRPFSIAFLSEAKHFDRLRKAAMKYDFSLLQTTCEELEQQRGSLGSIAAGVLGCIFKAAKLADQCNFGANKNLGAEEYSSETAQSVLETLPRKWSLRLAKDEQGTKILDYHEKYKSYIDSLCRENEKSTRKFEDTPLVFENPDNLFELYWNLRRAYERNAYADVLSRFYRLVEGLAEYRLETKYKISREQCKNDPKRKGVNGLFCLLQEKGDTIFNNTRNEEILRNKNQRNHTIVAHGMNPVPKWAADQCVEKAEDLMKAFFPDVPCTIEQMPLSRDTMLDMIDALEQIH
jgi:hypothetical protein